MGRNFTSDANLIDGLVQERRNSIANALKLRLSCINPLLCCLLLCSQESQDTGRLVSPPISPIPAASETESNVSAPVNYTRNSQVRALLTCVEIFYANYLNVFRF